MQGVQVYQDCILQTLKLNTQIFSSHGIFRVMTVERRSTALLCGTVQFKGQTTLKTNG